MAGLKTNRSGTTTDPAVTTATRGTAADPASEAANASVSAGAAADANTDAGRGAAASAAANAGRGAAAGQGVTPGAEPGGWRRAGQSLGALLGLHVLWLIAAWLVNKPVLPSPITVYAVLPQLASHQIGWHLYFSLYRLGWSLGWAALIGVPLGIAIVRLPRLGAWLDPVVYMTYPLPKIALLPVVMLLAGLGDSAKIIMIALITVFQIIISVRDAVRQVPDSLYKQLRVAGATRLELFWFATWPASLAGVLSALRIALGTAIATLFFTEVYGTNYGLGYFIMDEWNRLDYPLMYAGIVVLAAVAFALFAVLNAVERHVLRWQRG
ncbi:ABC transporter permease [Lacticaseibacillus parakribbianus]|uniref:ABC transporter permease n=1 Tax=Lacticaseibacillus parakribbianus TaxID=2970927 RepID=UPI0021CB75C4|nr:ABC transporter permease [Lacticaseibacillus parakribbianus]